MLAPLLFALLLQTSPEFVVGGRVVQAVTGQPLSRCKVFLAPVKQRTKAMVLLTGPDGRFRFEGIAPGQYDLSAERNGFVRQSYGQKTLYQPFSSSVAVGEKEDTAGLLFRLTPGAVITGYVTDANREPVPGITVFPLLAIGKGAQRHVRLGPPGTTDDRGYFRLYSLRAGNYAVAVTGRPWQSEGLESKESLVYPTTYFPGVMAPERADIFKVAAGEEVRADITLVTVPAVRVHGTIAGDHAQQTLTLTVQARSILAADLWVRNRQRIHNGRFELTDLPLGRYSFALWKDADMVATQTVDITSADQTITLGAAPLAEVSVTVEMANPEPGPGKQVVLSLVDAAASHRFARELERKGPTVFPGVPPGRYTVALGIEHQWAVLSVKARGASQTGGVVEIPETGKVELAVVADPNAAEVEGKVLRAGKAQPGVIVILAPKATWNDFTTYRVDQTNSDGSFTWPGVAAGDHLMFAFEEGEALDYADAVTLREHIREAKPLRITGEPKQTVKFELPPKPPTL